MNLLAKIAGLASLLAGVVMLFVHLSTPALPDLPKPLFPLPDPLKPDEPKKPRKPWCPRGEPVGFAVESKAPDGTEPMVDYPEEQWIANIGSRVDGKGMCVFTSFEHMARWSGLESFRGFRDWCAKNYAGGGYPEKLANLVEAYAKAKRISVPKLYQYEGYSLEVLENAMQTGRFAGCTLYHSKRYGGLIFHAVNCASAGPRYYAICDNNMMNGDGRPPYEWFDGAKAFASAIMLNGKYWCFVLERPGAPPPPKN